MAMTSASVSNRLALAAFCAALVPPFASLLLWRLAAGVETGGSAAAGWPVMLYGLAAAALLGLAVRSILAGSITDEVGPRWERERIVRLRRLGRGFMALLPVHALTAHLLAGYVTGGAPAESSPWLVLAAPLLLAGLVLLPVCVYAYGLLGRRYGARLSGRPLVPLGSRLVVLGLLLPLASVSTVPVYQLVRGGVADSGLMVVWCGVVAYVAAVFLIAYRNQRKGLAPLRELLARPNGDSLGDIAAASLDDVGVCVNRLRELQEHGARIEQALIESENRTRMFAEAASDYLYELDEHLRISFVSDRFEELTGIPTALIIGQSAIDLGRSHIAADRRAHQEDLLARRPYRRYRYSVRIHGGGVRHLHISGQPYFDETGRFKGYRGAGTDITEFVETEQRLLEKEAELNQAQRMEALGQLTGGVAHDFNNFLTAFMGHLEIALGRSDMPDDARRHVRAALDGARSSEALVHRLLAFSRRQTLRPATVDMGELLEDLGSMIEPLLGDRVRLSMDPVAGDISAMVDADQLKQSVLNLVMNARDAMPDGGTLYVSASLTLLSASDPSGLPPGDYISIVVADTGKGIDQHLLKYVFEPYFTTKPPGEGVGLGLSMTYGFAAQSGGGVRVDSAVGGGTQVEMLLPASGQMAVIDPAPEYMSGTGSEHLLVVEDDPALSLVVCQMLRELGYEVASVGDAAGALRFLDAHADVDLVVCDLILPGECSGLDVLRHAREQGHRAQWLLMSGFALGNGQLQEADTAGCEILRKPFRSRELADRVAALLNGSRPARAQVG